MCERGDTVKCNVLGRGVMIDRCIAPIINALNECGLVTAESCCGHGETEGHILFYQDGKPRLMVLYERGEPSIEIYQKKYRKYAEESEEKTKKTKKRKRRGVK